MAKKPLRIALAHEYLTRRGGAERVLHRIAGLYPDTPIYTLLKNDKIAKEDYKGHTVYESFLGKFPGFLRRRVKYLAPFCPTAAESIDLSKYDVVISSSNSFIKGVVTKPQTLHITYCHAPTNFAWDVFHDYVEDQKKGPLMSFGIKFLAHYIRQWDRQAADRVDYYIANSKLTQKRIKKFYRKDSEVIYPPVDTKRFKPQAKHDNYFLIVSQLTPYKKIDIAIQAFNRLNLPLVIVGDGADRKRLEKIAGENITFTGFLPDEDVVKYYENCRGFIFAGSDDFGIAPVEAMAAGKPVLALREGGALETIIEGETGEFFDAPIVELLADGVRRLIENESQYDVKNISKHASQFSQERFDKEFKKFVDSKIQQDLQ